MNKPAYRWSRMMCSDVAKPIRVKGGNCAQEFVLTKKSPEIDDY